MKRTRIRARSEAKEQEIDVRREMRRKVLERDGGCRGRLVWPEVKCWGGYELDEMKSRARGGDPTDISHVQLLCTGHNRAKEDHPDEAWACGLARHSWESPLVPVEERLPTARDLW